MKFILITQHEAPFVNASDATKKVERPNRGKCTNKRERRVGLSTLLNPFHTEHDPSDVIGLDNNTAMLLANSKTITDDVNLTLHYVSFEIFSPCTKIYSRTRLYNADAASSSRFREGDSLAINLRQKMVVLFRGEYIISILRIPRNSGEKIYLRNLLVFVNFNDVF